jgi:hypothetical protein
MTHHVDARMSLSPSKLGATAISELRTMCKQLTNARGIWRMRKADLIALITQTDDATQASSTKDDESIVREESQNAMVGIVLQDLLAQLIAMNPVPSFLTNQTQPIVGKESTNDGAFYEVEEILGSRWVDGLEMFHIRWKGFGSTDDTWEPIENFQNDT